MAVPIARSRRAALAAVMLLSIGICVGCGSSEEPKQVSQRIAASLKPGDVVTLTNERLDPAHRSGSVRLYSTRAAFDTAIQFAEAKDTAGIRAQAARGETFQVATGTRATVITSDAPGLVAEVRIQGGESANRTGWVPVPQIQP